MASNQVSERMGKGARGPVQVGGLDSVEGWMGRERGKGGQVRQMECGAYS
jgi:hypothetical protein